MQEHWPMLQEHWLMMHEQWPMVHVQWPQQPLSLRCFEYLCEHKGGGEAPFVPRRVPVQMAVYPLQCRQVKP